MSPTIISSWIRFEVSSSFQFDARLLLKPLREFNLPLRPVKTCYYGRIGEFSEEYLLVITWETHEALESFQKSKAWEEMLGVMKSYSEKLPDTKTIDFGHIMWYTRLDSCEYLGVKFVYFPESISQEKKEALEGIKSLHSHFSPGPGSPKNWFAAHASRSWVEGLRTYKGEKALAYLWCHKWRNKEREQDYNFGRNNFRKMASLNQELTRLEPLGWEEFHVHLQSWIRIKWSDDEEDEDEEIDDDEEGKDD
ncbi:Fc.00g010670.m01.CDS01 [Cosmosporella sp. VM-42]